MELLVECEFGMGGKVVVLALQVSPPGVHAPGWRSFAINIRTRLQGAFRG